MEFNYRRAFSRNIGWVTEEEQKKLKKSRVAIAGLGGVGGSHLLTLARLGVGSFNISDFDDYGIENFNRQAGAFISTLDQSKLDTMRSMLLDINPDAKVRVFESGVNKGNLDEFLDGVDLYVDSLDFFAVKARIATFEACQRKAIPAITAAPLGMGTAFLAFTSDSMSFEDYFRLRGKTENQQLARFLVGLSPALLQTGYLVDKSTVDFEAKKGPSTAMACELCAGVAATNALKILLQRGKVVKAPHGLHFDAYRNRLKITWRPWGNRNPLQLVAIKMAERLIRPDT